MSFQFRRRPDSSDTRDDQRDPYFDFSNAEAYRDYRSRESVGNDHSAERDPRYPSPYAPLPPGAFAFEGDLTRAYRPDDPYYPPTPRSREDPRSPRISGDSRYFSPDAVYYDRPTRLPNFSSESTGEFVEANPYARPFQASQIPRQTPPGDKFKPAGFARSDEATLTGFEEFDRDSPSPVKLLVSLVGVTILVALSWFAYKWVKAPEEDAVPLIHAEEGAHKVRPDHRGGVNVPYQDKLIYERIADADQPEERLLPPPEEPIALDESVPVDDYMEDARAEEEVGQNAYEREPLSEERERNYREEALPPPRDRRHANERDRASGEPPPRDERYPDSLGRRQALASERRGLPGEENPKRRLSENVYPPEKEKPLPPLARGEFFVQLATVRSKEAALREWQRLKTKHDLRGLSSLIKESETSEGDTVYRLLMGPFDEKTKALKRAAKIGGSKLVRLTE